METKKFFFPSALGESSLLVLYAGVGLLFLSAPPDLRGHQKEGGGLLDIIHFHQPLRGV